MKFRKKPVVVEAVQFVGEASVDEMSKLWGKDFVKAVEFDPVFGVFTIETLEGFMEASKGDWIIQGVNGEFYPCKPDIFKKTYEAVND